MENQKNKPRLGFKQSANTPEALDIYLYGDIGKGYYDWWEDTYHEDNSSERLKSELEKHPSVKTINLFINSFGGDVFEGTAIANQLRRHPATVVATIDGFACSIASVIAVAADKVRMPKNAVMMIHNMWTVAMGNSDQLRKVADDMDVLMEANRTIYLEKSEGKIDEDTLISLLNAESYLTAEECFNYGFCDEVVDYVSLDEAFIEKENGRVLSQLATLQRNNALLNQLCTFEEDEALETLPPEDEKPKNFLESFFE